MDVEQPHLELMGPQGAELRPHCLGGWTLASVASQR